jgi:hypothetical protein
MITNEVIFEVGWSLGRSQAGCLDKRGAWSRPLKRSIWLMELEEDGFEGTQLKLT